MVRRVLPLCVVALLFVAGCTGVGDSPATSTPKTAGTITTTDTTLAAAPENTTVETYTTVTVAPENATTAYWINDGVLRFEATGSRIDCRAVTVDVLFDVIDRNTEKPLNSIGVGHRTTDEYEGYTVNRDNVLNRDGEVIFSALVSYSTLQETVPGAVNGTVTVDGESTVCTEPIRVFNRTLQQQ